MANIDNPNGFTWVEDLAGFGERLKKVNTNGTFTKGDAVIKSSEKVAIALEDSNNLIGIWAGPAIASTVPTWGLFYPALPWYVFEGQCEGTESDATHIFYATNIKGTTGIMEIDQGQTDEGVIYITGRNPNSAEGANARMYFIIKHSEYLPLLVGT